MSRFEKLQRRFLSVPKDFTWEELVKILSAFGYEEIIAGKTGGSRRKFKDSNNNIISLHKPHPSSILKEYTISDVINHLKINGHIKHE
ncbi:type II toxin-antitoxin system HicA family toxin [Daejeonella sp.]|uniref:type II toxin-antitoxin system HicA family toxin n=1 Tax=Daejeonella sp. TaxID=2805397 RepID=UPI00272FC942|nr:type II toxin-antitoxin system HicA family toxin [Daejeonella sp.]MDP2413051.1 type II toxin-antitoxin system HicA family toxin [Daejeonella sp.]